MNENFMKIYNNKSYQSLRYILIKCIIIIFFVLYFSFSIYYEDSEFNVSVKYNPGLRNIYFMESCILYLILYPEVLTYLPEPIPNIFNNYFENNNEEIENIRNQFIIFVKNNYEKQFEYFNFIDKFKKYYDFYKITYFFYELVDYFDFFESKNKISKVEYNFNIDNYDEYTKKIYLEASLILNYIININYYSNNCNNYLTNLTQNIISSFYSSNDLKRIENIIKETYFKYAIIFNLFSNKIFFDQKLKFRNINFEFNLNSWETKISAKLNRNLIIIKLPLIKLSEEYIIFIISHELGHLVLLDFENQLSSQNKETANSNKIDFFYDFMGKKMIIPKKLYYQNKVIKFDENIELLQDYSCKYYAQQFDFEEIIADLSATLFFKVLFNKFSCYRSEFYLVSLYEKKFFEYNEKYLKNPELFFANYQHLLKDIFDFNIIFFDSFLKFNKNKYYLYQYNY